MTEAVASTAGPAQLRRVALASAVGTTIEWYDYFIYSTAAALIFGSQFFSTLEPASATLAAFATLGVGFIARPVGGILWGHFGDRVGRKAMLVASLLLMGVATVGVGLLPTFAQIGVWAPVLLLVLRLLQGLSAGGEWGGAALMAVEHAPAGQKGRYGAYSQIGVPAGLILAQLVFVLVGATLTDEQFAAWGWRLPFLLSIVLVAVGLFIRLRIEESPVFRELRSGRERARLPMVEVFRERPRELLIASVSFIANTAIGYVFLAYLLSYGTSVLGLSRTLMLTVVIVGSVSWLVSIIVAARWSDRVGRKPVYLVGSVLLVVWPVPFFLLIDTGDPALMVVSVIVLTIGLGLSYGPQSALFAEMFEARYRYSGASFSYAVGAVLGGGFAPVVATALQSATGTSLSVAAYMIATAVVSLLAVLAIREPVTSR
ncbi:MFS transporter [Pseudonocardia petroleophila]|uniref:Putative proline/betaine transporter n=1 Tax=Pseudonocardia petroleophila TaxID=37331 RepID=A0A7G7MRG2_9PSEU|nr:MFS transporter [Pseudonocardia petroleophila]QNG55373.1 MHS family MFS transporter [Pseudonocardia petroleophila]